MSTRTLPAHDLKLIDDRRLIYQGTVGVGPFQGAAFQAEDGLGVIVSIDTDVPTGAAFRLSVTRPGFPPTDDDLAVVRIAICGPGSKVRIETPEESLLRGQIVHLVEEPEAYEPPDAPWWTDAEFVRFAVQMAQASGTAPERAQENLTALESFGLIRIHRRHDPKRGDLVQVDLRPLFWREQRRQAKGV